MLSRRALLGAIFSISIILVFSACSDVSPTILSDSEKEQIYEVNVKRSSISDSSLVTVNDASAISVNPGTLVRPAQVLSVFCNFESNSETVTQVNLSLVGSSGVELGLVSYALSADATPSASFTVSPSATPANTATPASSTSPSPAAAASPNGTDSVNYVNSFSSRALSLTVPQDAANGTYRLKVALLNSASIEVYSKSILVFLVNKDYSLDSVQVCPSEALPGSYIVLQASASYPKDQDPYFIWKYGSKVIGKGSASEGFDQLLWQSPSTEGIYSVTCYLYPYAPEGGSAFTFDSELSCTAKIGVSSTAVDENSPYLASRDSSFYSVFHFDGSVSELGSRDKTYPAKLSANSLIKIYGAGYGYQFDSESKLSVADYLIPVKGGSLSAFSLLARLVWDGEGSGALFQAGSASGDFSFALKVNAAGALSVTVLKDKVQAIAVSGARLDSQVHDLCLNVLPINNGSSLFIQWFLDGVETGHSIVAFDNKLIPDSGLSVIGGKGSASVILDEFGVYSKTTDEGVEYWANSFEYSALKQYHDDLIFAYGFDGQALPAGLSLGKDSVAAVSSGALALGANSSVKILPLGDLTGNIVLSMPYRSIKTVDEKGLPPQFSFMSGGKVVASIGLDGSLTSAQGTSELYTFAPNVFFLKLTLSDGVCYADSGSSKIKLFSYGKIDSPVIYLVSNRAEITAESLLARYSNASNSILTNKAQNNQKDKSAFEKKDNSTAVSKL
jgi:hypothetical protein